MEKREVDDVDDDDDDDTDEDCATSLANGKISTVGGVN